MFHVEHPIGRTEQVEIGVEGREDKLRLQPSDLGDKPTEVVAIQLGGRVIEEEGRVRLPRGPQ
jgi:hypothetical protein